ncbi:MAG: hypothetical protein LBM26_05690 [Methanobrevibacter sp.]|jgi:hypothetical protein|nr:hypothetical protein [Methanobrevibacter sp.]
MTDKKKKEEKLKKKIDKWENKVELKTERFIKDLINDFEDLKELVSEDETVILEAILNDGGKILVTDISFYATDILIIGIDAKTGEKVSLYSDKSSLQLIIRTMKTEDFFKCNYKNFNISDIHL